MEEMKQKTERNKRVSLQGKGERRNNMRKRRAREEIVTWLDNVRPEGRKDEWAKRGINTFRQNSERNIMTSHEYLQNVT